jgi:glucose-1-phosphate thymidylyltransferase
VVREKRPERLGRSSTLRLNDEGRVVAFAEKAAEPLSNLICPPLYLFRRETLPLVKRYLDAGYSPDAPGHLVEWLYRQTPVYGIVMPDGRYDIGNPESYREACQALGD